MHIVQYLIGTFKRKLMIYTVYAVWPTRTCAKNKSWNSRLGLFFNFECCNKTFLKVNSSSPPLAFSLENNKVDILGVYLKYKKVGYYIRFNKCFIKRNITHKTVKWIIKRKSGYLKCIWNNQAWKQNEIMQSIQNIT